VLSYADLEAGKRFGRYLDVDADGITWRTYPARTRNADPSSRAARAATATRATRKRAARTWTTCSGLLKKFETAKDYVPKPVIHQAPKPSRFGVIYYGSTSPAMDEALVLLDDESLQVDAIRVRAFPVPGLRRGLHPSPRPRLRVEQNRDAQLRTLLVTEAMIAPEKLTPVLHYDARRSRLASSTGDFTAAEGIQRDAHEAHGRG
jgi:2-oxoglutarate ferredoxin oxidoreductase subunit alpha